TQTVSQPTEERRPGYSRQRRSPQLDTKPQGRPIPHRSRQRPAVRYPRTFAGARSLGRGRWVSVAGLLRTHRRAIIRFAASMPLSTLASVVFLVALNLAAQELGLSNIHVEKKPGQQSGPVIAIVNGKPRRVLPDATQVWAVMGGKNLLALIPPY